MNQDLSRNIKFCLKGVGKTIGGKMENEKGENMEKKMKRQKQEVSSKEREEEEEEKEK